MAALEDINAEFFKPYLTVLKYYRSTGIDIFDERNVLLFKFKYAPVFIFLCFVTITYFHWLYVVYAIDSGMDLVDYAVELSLSYNAVECCILYVYICMIKGKIKNYVMKLQELWRNDDSLLPEGILLKRDQIEQMDKHNLYLCKLLDIFMYFYLGSPLVIIFFKKMLGQDAPYDARLKFKMPFDYQSNIVIFVFFFIFDYAILWTQVFTVYGCLFFLSITMNQLRTLFLLVQEDFKTIIKTRDIDVQVKLKRTIQNHYKLLDMLPQLGDAYGGIFALHIFFVCITICFYGIAAKINSRLEDVKHVMVSAIETVVIYYCCKNGQLATDSALDVATVIYDGPWEDLSISNRKIISLIILRSQCATYIRSTNFTEISLRTFKTKIQSSNWFQALSVEKHLLYVGNDMEIMNTTYSFLSLVANMYEK